MSKADKNLARRLDEYAPHLTPARLAAMIQAVEQRLDTEQHAHLPMVWRPWAGFAAVATASVVCGLWAGGTLAQALDVKFAMLGLLGGVG